jgi:hypothetical protein
MKARFMIHYCNTVFLLLLLEVLQSAVDLGFQYDVPALPAVSDYWLHILFSLY